MHLPACHIGSSSCIKKPDLTCKGDASASKLSAMQLHQINQTLICKFYKVKRMQEGRAAHCCLGPDSMSLSAC